MSILDASRCFRGRACGAIALLALAFVTQSAFTCGPDFVDPCEDDYLGCRDDGELDYLESCSVEGELRVEAGHGESAFAPFTGTAPRLYTGGQGGQHLFAALRVENAALDLYDRLKVTLILEQRTECGTFGAQPEPDDPDTCYRADAGRILVLGPRPALRRDSAGAVEESGLLLQIGYLDAGEPARLRVSVEDPCRRTGTALGDWTP